MQIKSYAIQRYWSMDYQKFSEKIIEAIGLFSLFKDFNREDLNKIIFLRDYTNQDVRVPIYKIDRVINPFKGRFNLTNNKYRFTQLRPEREDEPCIELTEDMMQYYCCLAVEKVHSIILQNISTYAEEVPMPDFGDDDMTTLTEFNEVTKEK